MAALGRSFVVIVRHDRLIDISPCSDIDRRVFIRVCNMSTGDTLKTGLGFAIGFVDMPASRALARGIAWINILDNNAFPLRLVLDKGLKLKERPTAVLGSVGFPNRGPFADVLEVFKFDSAPGVFGFRDEAFRNNVVLVSPESGFVPPNALQVATGGTRPFGLQVFSEGMVAAAGVFHDITRERFAVRIGGNLHDTQVNPDKTIRLNRWRGRRFHHHQQVEHAIHQNQIGLSMAAPKLNSLVVAHLHRDRQPSLHRQDANRFQTLKAQDALVINDRAGRLEKALLGLIALVGINDFGNSANRQLRRQPKLLPHVVVNQMMKKKLGRALLAIGHFRNVITSGVERAHGFQQCGALGLVRKQFDLKYRFHNEHYAHKDNPSQAELNTADRPLGGSLYLPGLQAGVSRREFQ